MTAIPLFFTNALALPDTIPPDTTADLVKSRVLSYDHMQTFRLDVPTLHRLGVDLRHLFWHWAEPPRADNLLWGNMRCPDVLRGLKYVLTQRAVAERLPDLDWFAMGLSVQDLLVLRLFDVDSMLLFRVTFDKLLQHKAYEMGSLWSAETRWTEHDFARLGYTKDKFRAFVEAEQMRNPAFSRELAEAFVPTGRFRLKAPRLAGSVFAGGAEALFAQAGAGKDAVAAVGGNEAKAAGGVRGWLGWR